MKPHGILFSGAMVRTILEGRKTQTRRVIDPQPPYGLNYFGRVLCSTTPSEEGKHVWYDSDRLPKQRFAAKCPHGPVGRKLWVRETLTRGCFTHLLTGNELPNYPVAKYKADGDDVLTKQPDGFEIEPWWKGKGDLPAIHMPQRAARIWLEVTEIRCQRLQEITEEDAIAEGIEEIPKSLYPLNGRRRAEGPFWRHYESESLCANDPVTSYLTLWNSIDGPGSWHANPWVWAYTFKRIERP